MVGYILSAVLLLILLLLLPVLIRCFLESRRLKKLSEAMEDYLAGNGGQLPLSLKEDTVAQVENAAAEMQNRIETAEERFRREARRTSDLTADISHQLKTPLASLRLFCEMDNSPHCARQLSQIERMETLISSLLRLEKLCADGYDFTFADCDLRLLAEQSWEQLRPLWPDRVLTVEGGAVVRCDEKWMSEAFRNLMKNACEHTQAGGRIRVRIEQEERACYCILEDNGGGAAEKDLPRLFERFYRAEGHTAGGAGLGLAIVKEIIFRHHGHITAENTAEGLRFVITLPVLNLVRAEA